MTYGDFKNLARRMALHKVLHDKAFNITNNLKYSENQTGLTSMINKVLLRVHG